MENKIKFSDILKTVIPTILMMCFMSIYTIVDGAFVSRLIGTDALSAVNIVYPFINFILGISIMIGSGSCALVMKKIGEGKEEEARSDFSLILLITLGISIVLTALGIIFIDYIIKFLGGTENLYNYCKSYLFFMVLFATPTIFKFIIEQFLVAINKPKTALLLSATGGVLNIILDYLFIGVLKWGIKGAGIATGLGYAIPAVIGVLFFISKKSIVHFRKPSKNFKCFLNSCSNGLSEMISQLSNGIITLLFNLVALKLLGEDGVAAITIILYIQFLVTSIFTGYTIGIAPRISYTYGNGDSLKLKSIISISLKFIYASSIISYLLILALSSPLVQLFAPSGTNVYNITILGLKIYSLAFLLAGINIFMSGMFTAFSNGKVSAIISFFRTLTFESLGIIVFPLIFGILGMWIAVPIAQVLGILISIYFYKK